MKNKVGIYTRVSSETQVLEGHSLEWQEHDLLEYAKNHNLHIVDKYVERGISGEEIETRPQLLRLIKDIEDKKINNILVYKIDRLGRQVFTNAKIYKILVANNCILTTSAYGVMDLYKAYDTFMYNMLSSVSQFEVNNLSERVINGKKQRVRNGFYINSNSVYGYDNYYNKYSGDRLLEVNDYESAIINEIYESYLSGKSMKKIADGLNDRKVSTKRGGKWCQSTIKSILTNKLYIGIVVYNGNAKTDCFENKGVHEPIIDTNVFNKVQDLIRSKSRNRVKKAPTEFSYFSPLLTYNGCGFKPKQIKSKDKTSIRYYCKNKDFSFPSIKHIELEEKFARELSNIKLEFNDKIVKGVFKNNDYDIISKLLDKIKKEQNNLFEFLNNDIISMDDFKERMEVVKSKKENLQRKQDKLKGKLVMYDDAIKDRIYSLLENNLMDIFMSFKQVDKMNFVNLFVDKILIDELHNINIQWKSEKTMT